MQWILGGWLMQSFGAVQYVRMKYIQIMLLFALCVPASVSASHSRSVDTSDLDKDIVETFQVPVLLGTDYYQLTPDFGVPRGGGARSHEGQDMLAPRGTPVVSPTEAVVIGTGVWSGGGNYVQTANPGGERFRYMHLDQIADIKRGDELDIGDLIGTVGDTGNAGAGVYHLHFEVLDEDGEPQDPYPRLSDEPWNEAQVADFLTAALNNIDDEDEYAELLVETFPNELFALQQAGERLPRELRSELADTDVSDRAALLEQLNKLIQSIPAVIPTGLTVGDEGGAVSLLQLYISTQNAGPAATRLAQSGATGYFGPITQAAVLELQLKTDVSTTGVFDAPTKVDWADV